MGSISIIQYNPSREKEVISTVGSIMAVLYMLPTIRMLAIIHPLTSSCLKNLCGQTSPHNIMALNCKMFELHYENLQIIKPDSALFAHSFSFSDFLSFYLTSSVSSSCPMKTERIRALNASLLPILIVFPYSGMLLLLHQICLGQLLGLRTNHQDPAKATPSDRDTGSTRKEYHIGSIYTS